MGYDLLSVPTGYKTDLLLVVSPYIDTHFVSTVLKSLAPRHIRLVVDDGIRYEDLKKIRKCFGRTDDVKFALGAAPALVHIKGFYIEFVKSRGLKRRKRRFFFGSANATEAAFGGIRNAELIAGVDLLAEHDKALIQYFSLLRTAIEDGSGAMTGRSYGPLGNSPTLRLPSFKVVPPGPAPGFDSWLQRGFLAAKYRDAQQFLVLGIPLKSRLPQAVVTGMFALRRLLQEGTPNIVRYSYVQAESVDNGEDGDDANIPQWKAKYCNWTHLGDWLSDTCYGELSESMVAKSAPLRQSKMNEIVSHGGETAWREGKIELLLNTMSDLWRDLRVAGHRPELYLNGGKLGIDRSHYGERFEKKMVTDFRLAQDGEFRSRYVNGYEFPDVPRFRQDTAAWDSFVLSWCESIGLEASKGNPRSLLTRAIVSVGEKVGVKISEFDPDEIRDWLRKSWERVVRDGGRNLTVGHLLENYYKGDPISE